MSKVLFIFPNTPISENATGGGGVVFRNHLVLLARKFSEVHLVQLISGDDTDKFDEYFLSRETEYAEIRQWFKSRKVIRLQNDRPRGRLISYARLIANKSRFAFPFLSDQNKSALEAICHDLKPDLVWAEHLIAGILSNHFIRSTNIPLFYSHHDWEYKLRPLRNSSKDNTWRFKFISWLTKREELSTARNASVVVFSSHAEFVEGKEIGAARPFYLPLFVSAPSATAKAAPQDGSFTLYHLGGMQTTSNRVGLENFSKYCWPALKASIPEIRMMLIGSMRGATDAINVLLADPSVDVRGYVQSVDDILEPNCLHVIPWDKNTGTRTKVPIAMRNRQIVVGFTEGLKGYAELTDGENVLLATTFDALVNKIMDAYKNKERLVDLGTASFQTYATYFTEEAVFKKFEEFLKDLPMLPKTNKQYN